MPRVSLEEHRAELMTEGKGPRHHSIRRGSLALVVLRDGTEIKARFKEPNRRFLLLEDQPRIPWSKVRRFRACPKVLIS